MKYNFDEIVERKGTKSYKWDGQKFSFKTGGLLPFWVADSDFRTPPEIIEALSKIVKHGVFGYSLLENDYYEASTRWYQRRFGWKVSPEWIFPTCGVVTSISYAIRAFTEKGDKVLINTPVYGPFFRVTEKNNREVVECALKFNGNRYEIDFDDMEAKCAAGVKMLLLCSPHNPVGRVWEKNELEKIISICKKYGIIIVSDEIHADLVYKGHKHIPAGLLADNAGYAHNTVVCAAASKTFNIPGLQTSNCIISDKALRDKFIEEVSASFIPEPNVIGTVATQVAYDKCEGWLEEQLSYLEGNIDTLVEYFSKNLPEIDVIRPEGTYLAWLDFRKLGKTNEELMKLLIEKGGVALSDGLTFGERGEGYMRFNFACPKSMMLEGLERIKKALHS